MSGGSGLTTSKTLPTLCGVPLKYLSLGVLAGQNAAAILMMRYTRTIPTEKLYLTSSAVIMGEFVKFFVSLCIVFYTEGNLSVLFADRRELLLTGVPSAIYLVQNNLQYLAVSRLHAAVYQVTYQVKILSTALLAVVILNKKISGVQWFALFVLTGGVILVQVSQFKPEQGDMLADPTNQMDMGIVFTLLATLCSGAAGVFFQKILKDAKLSIWTRNAQMAMYSMLIGLFYQLTDGSIEIVLEKGFFYGFTPLTVVNILVQSLGGIIVAVVIKYADVILKNFATSMSVIISSFVSAFYMDFELSLTFFAGVFLVQSAVFIYTKPPALKSKKTGPTDIEMQGKSQQT